MRRESHCMGKGRSMKARIDVMSADPKGLQLLLGVERHIASSKLEPKLLHLVKMRASQINGCAYCINKHSGGLLKGGMDLEKVLLVGVWREADDLFDEVERAALAWAESVTRVADTNVPDSDYQAAAAVFDEKQLAEYRRRSMTLIRS